MKKHHLLAPLLITMLIVAVQLGRNSTPIHATAPSGYSLVWSDDFDGSELDETKWRYQIGSWNGSQVQNCYLSDNVAVSGGSLILTSEYAPATACYSAGTRDFTSGFVQTKDRAAWTYGYFEARLKMPNNDSSWPAFWMSPQNNEYGSWPLSGEIDVFEAKGHDTSTVYANAHWGNSAADKQQDKGSYAVGNITDWHVYGVEWNEGELKFYADGVHYHTINNFDEPNATTHPGPFNIDYYLRLNVATGGTFLTAPYNDANNSIADFPSTMEVDYVRVYQKSETPADPDPPIDNGNGTDGTSGETGNQDAAEPSNAADSDGSDDEAAGTMDPDEAETVDEANDEPQLAAETLDNWRKSDLSKLPQPTETPDSGLKRVVNVGALSLASVAVAVSAVRWHVFHALAVHFIKH